MPKRRNESLYHFCMVVVNPGNGNSCMAIRIMDRESDDNTILAMIQSQLDRYRATGVSMTADKIVSTNRDSKSQAILRYINEKS